jgi:hypothetical protein
MLIRINPHERFSSYSAPPCHALAVSIFFTSNIQTLSYIQFLENAFKPSVANPRLLNLNRILASLFCANSTREYR